ncbi:MAG TPA: outer membrane beta-barrel protein, partial [Candidatus Sulfotelmatobacter sp.]|nr:outer membrane beta-barrel protein [Candidatus Sulfotelmatobacter sp.]
MRIFFARAALLVLILVPFLGLAAWAADGTADGTKKDDSSSKPAAKPDSTTKPASALTEREQWMLERIEQLEKRVAELESKENGAVNANTALQTNSPAPALGVSPAALTSPATVSSAAPAVAATPATTATATTASVQPGSSSRVNPQDQNAQTAAVATNANPQVVAPFSDWDWTWLNGNPRTKDIYWDTPFFTPEIRFDTNYVADFNHPTDHTIGGSSELFRSYEIQLEQAGIGGDFHWDNVRGRIMTQFGMYSATTPRNDASPAHGQWDLDTAYRYISEAYGGYHFNVLHGINVDAGIFLSYIGLFSYYNFDNWAYQPSYVSSNTPWFFNGLRVQIFPTIHLKIEPWLINGWQSYAS